MKPEHLEAMQAGRAKRSAEERRTRIEEILTGDRQCSCGITPDSTDRELRAMGAGCTAPWFICGALDAIRRTI